jgi:hypothetical protein
MANEGIDIPLTANGNDIEFSRDTVSGLDEYRQAALLRITNDVTYTDNDYGIDIAGELGSLGGSNYAQLLGLRCSSAILNDNRFATARATRATQTAIGGNWQIALAFEVVVGDGTTFDLAVLVANGTVKLLEEVA